MRVEDGASQGFRFRPVRGGFRGARGGGRARLLLGAAAISCAACVGSSEPGQLPSELSQYVVEATPEAITPLNINYDDKITLVGAEVKPGEPVKPGDRVRLKMYWRVHQVLDDPDWKLFTHVFDGKDRRLLNIDNVGPLRRFRRNHQAWPPGRWEAGKIYVDEQSFVVPRNVRTDEIRVATGIWKGRERLAVKGGPSLSGNRGLVATLQTGPKGSEAGDVPALEVARVGAGKRVAIDGKLDEPAWAEAASTGAFVDVATGKPAEGLPQGSAKLLWDTQYLYVGFAVEDESVTGGFDEKKPDPHLWTKDCVELMIDPDPSGDNRDYYEIQVNPQNLVFDSRFDSYNQPVKRPDGPFGHQEWSAKLDSAVRVEGTLDKADDEDEGYTVELRIPWSSFGKAAESPPKPGETWRVNLYAMQNNGGVAWSPILGQGNFHKASRFGRLKWVVERTAAVAKAAPKGADVEAATEKAKLVVEKKALGPGGKQPAKGAAKK